MVNIYASFTDAQKRAKLEQLSGVYEQLVSGDKSVQITHDGAGSTTYKSGDMRQLERLILGLQADLGIAGATRGPVGICYGG